MRILFQELHEALRQIRRSPGFSVLALLLLAAGIGSTVAVFSLFHSLILQPLPFREPDRLIGIEAINRETGLVQSTVSVADAADLGKPGAALQTAGAYRPNFSAFTRPGEPPLRLVTGLVTAGLLDTLGLQPLLGRLFHPDEFSFAAARVVLLSHAAWQRLFDADPGVLGQVMILDDEPCTIIGVMPESFREPAYVEAWLPFPTESPEYFARDSRFWTLVARLAPGATAAQAQAELATTAARLAQQYPDTNRSWGVATVPLQELRTRQLRPALLLLLAAVLLVLVIVCLNLANLLLARELARLPQLALRLALGATPRRLAARVFTEALCLAAVGAALGALGAAVLVPWTARQLPPGLIARAHEATVHPAALLLAVALAFGCAAAAAVLPAWQALRSDLETLLKQGAARTLGGAGSRWQGTLMVAQIALTVAVLGGALLLMKSLQQLQGTSLGFNPQQILALRLAPPPQRYQTTDDLARYYQDLLDAAARVPGVKGAAVNASAPLTGISLTYPTWPAGRNRDAASATQAVYAPVNEGYFELVEQRLLQGRTFTAHDRAGGAPVAVVNATYARRAFPGRSAVGERVLLLPWMGETYREIVGVVADTLQEDLASAPAAQVYVPQRQMPWFFSTLLIALEQPGAAPALQAALQAVDPSLPFAPSHWSEDVAATALQPRWYARLFGAFALIALGLSAFGLYAGLRCHLQQRQREIGVRMALGATPQQIARWILLRSGRWVLAGTAAGVCAAIPLALALRGQLVGVSPFDPTSFLLLPVTITTVALFSALPTALRAARLPPLQALNNEP